MQYSSCPAAGENGASQASYAAATATAASTSTVSAEAGVMSSYRGTWMRISVEPSSCQIPTDCAFGCSATYDVRDKTVAPGTLPEACKCYTGTVTNIPGLSNTVTFEDGSTATVYWDSICRARVSTTIRGVTCMGRQVTCMHVCTCKYLHIP